MPSNSEKFQRLLKDPTGVDPMDHVNNWDGEAMGVGPSGSEGYPVGGGGNMEGFSPQQASRQAVTSSQ